MQDNFNMLSAKEKQLFEYIKQDPYITQKELAEKVGLSRPSIANLISGLMKKGFIRGKAYIVNENEQVVCIGGANVDRKFYGKEPIQLGTSNPVHVTQSIGGVARNIAENLGRFGLDVSLLTASGNDSDWQFIKEASAHYMNLDHSTQLPDARTGSYTAVLDRTGELIVALADMDVYESITPSFVKQQMHVLHHARCIMADLNCPKETLEFLSQYGKNKEVAVFLVAVSAPKMKRIPEDLQGITWLIMNHEEAETYLGVTIETEETWHQALDKLLALGAKNAVITNGKHGVMIGNESEGIHHIKAVDPGDIVDVTGAGDAFSAAVLYAWLEGYELREIGKAGVLNASKTLKSAYTVRQDLSPTQFQKDMEEST
ncbi:carbohydrate kinase [Oceanobacillus halotolerans]|uniref:carbohydrate kinase n=1 Tax=Oceanobacillus halotolerans TaxID=2663380 RepID=UPI001CF76A40|nr:carbohydrate kinase [Oceanobacillus halotolerans]